MNRRMVIAAACALATTSVVARQPGESGSLERLSHVHTQAALADARERAVMRRVNLVEAVDARAAGVAGQPRARPTQPTVAVPPPPPPPPAPPAPAPPQGQPVNVKVEFTITDQREGAAAIKRAVSVIVADRNLGRVRSAATVFGPTGEVPLNVDATPIILNNGKVKLQFTLSYDLPGSFEIPPAGSAVGRVAKTTVQDSVSLILENGKSMVAAQSADPIGDRQVTVEVKATILK